MEKEIKKMLDDCYELLDNALNSEGSHKELCSAYENAIEETLDKIVEINTFINDYWK